MRAKKYDLDFSWDKQHDNQLPRLIKTIKAFQDDNNDDYFLLIVGETGTGKTSLGLYSYELYSGEDAVINQVGLNQQDFARAIKSAMTNSKRGLRGFCMFDEANVFGREAMTPFNRDVIRLFLEIRGLKIFHIWCTPSLAMLDNALIDDKVNGLIFIYTKTKDHPRLYYFFTRDDIDKMRRQEGTKSAKARLTMDLLRKKSKYYATYKGCFRQYNGVLLEDYLTKKQEKMVDRVDEFYEKWGSERLSQADMSREALVAESTINNWVSKAVREGTITPGDDFIISASGKKLFSRSGADKVIMNYGRTPVIEGLKVSKGPHSIIPRKGRGRRLG